MAVACGGAGPERPVELFGGETGQRGFVLGQVEAEASLEPVAELDRADMADRAAERRARAAG
ncbi:hypothetical protein ACWDQO_23895, partial [Streptomyces sp. NPDC003703]